MQGMEHTFRRLIEISLSDGVNYTYNSCVANLSYRIESTRISNVYSTQCRIINIQSFGVAAACAR